ncbi:hypothetical protein GB931_17320 [Modestobacter sp. I12A-02628]|uniref:Uncharacterized protein n=1 Tax=Goekera deserti TaxID=2497753 RepID=A0A7K3WE66_9ACTN|nr:hypothetical protein [Goekera deserti]MPQ99646.1 hypothetical protein [Goekera deserti]NDI46344.1 hypothetical protein [Goekera deserti]NEL54724.1 hypothetical protein [Goekera deserti]
MVVLIVVVVLVLLGLLVLGLLAYSLLGAFGRLTRELDGLRTDVAPVVAEVQATLERAAAQRAAADRPAAMPPVLEVGRAGR